MEQREQIRQWVVKKAAVTCPYKKYWSASVTLGGMDINGQGDTIEKAYQDLTDLIFGSEYYRSQIQPLLPA